MLRVVRYRLSRELEGNTRSCSRMEDDFLTYEECKENKSQVIGMRGRKSTFDFKVVELLSIIEELKLLEGVGDGFRNGGGSRGLLEVEETPGVEEGEGLGEGEGREGGEEAEERVEGALGHLGHLGAKLLVGI